MSFSRYSKYVPSGVPWLGEIPSSWGLAPGRRLFRQIRDSALPTDAQLSATQKYGVVPQSLFMQWEDQKVTLALSGLNNFKHVQKGDFVISLRSFQGGIEHSKYEGCVSPAYTVLRPESRLVPDFYSFALKSNGYIAALQSVTDGIRDGKNISYEQFGQISLPVPSKEEQRLLAAFLNRETAKIDALVTEQEKLIALLKEKRQAVISHAVTKGLDPSVRTRDSGIDWLSQVPEHWSIVPVKHVARVGNGSTPNRDRLDYWQDGSFAWLNSGAVNQGLIAEPTEFVTETAIAECHLPIVKPPAVVLGITGEGKTRGMSALLGIETTINQHLAFVKPIDGRVSVAFLHRYFQMAYEQMRFESGGGGSTKGAITCAQIAQMRVPVPPPEEAAEIVALLARTCSELDALMAQSETAMALLSERRGALISAAVTGKIDVRGAVELEHA